jgi:hypothetical protein
MTAVSPARNQRQERVAGDVEGHSEEDVARALVELARQLAVLDVELKQRVAGRQRHLGRLGRVPRGDDVAATPGVLAQLVHQPRDLVDAVGRVGAVGLFGGAEGPPLVPVDGAEVARGATEARALLGAGPVVPDRNTGGLQRRHVGLAAQKPQQLVQDRPQMQPLRGQQREPTAQIEAHLVAEDPERAGAGAVVARAPLVEDAA